MIPVGTKVKYLGHVIAWQNYEATVVGHGQYHNKGPEKNIVEFIIIDRGNQRYFDDTDLRIIDDWEIVPVSEEKKIVLTPEAQEIDTFSVKVPERKIGDRFVYNAEEGTIVNIHKNGDFWVDWDGGDIDDLNARFFFASGLPAHRFKVDGLSEFISTNVPRHPSSQKFHDWLATAGDLHDRKQKDYGTDADPFANVRRCENYGIPGWVGCAVRMADKMARIERAVGQWSRGEEVQMSNEALLDSFDDLGVYAGIGRILYEESLEPSV